MRKAKQDTGRVRRPYTKRARPQQQPRQQKQLKPQPQPQPQPHHELAISNPTHPVHITEVVDDQQVGHLPLPQPIHGDVSELQDRVNDLGDSWETESIFEDIIDDLTHDTFPPDGNYSLSFQFSHFPFPVSLTDSRCRWK